MIFQKLILKILSFDFKLHYLNVFDVIDLIISNNIDEFLYQIKCRIPYLK